jgi:hypothetical protein
MISRRAEGTLTAHGTKRVIDVRGQTFEVHFYGYEDSDNEFEASDPLFEGLICDDRRDENEWATPET